MNLPVFFDLVLATNSSERHGVVRPFVLLPLLLVAAIVAFVVWSSDATLEADQHMLSPYLQSGMAP